MCRASDSSMSLIYKGELQMDLHKKPQIVFRYCLHSRSIVPEMLFQSLDYIQDLKLVETLGSFLSLHQMSFLVESLDRAELLNRKRKFFRVHILFASVWQVFAYAVQVLFG